MSNISSVGHGGSAHAQHIQASAAPRQAAKPPARSSAEEAKESPEVEAKESRGGHGVDVEA